MLGQGVDEHLLGLMVAADKAGMEEPELFTDAGFTKSVSFLLDTSQVLGWQCTYYIKINIIIAVLHILLLSTDLQLPFLGHEDLAMFTPLLENGYGICYNPLENKVLLTVCSFRSCPDTDSMVFGSTFMESMREMRAMLLAVKALL